MFSKRATFAISLAYFVALASAIPAPNPEVARMASELRLTGRSAGPDGYDISCGCDGLSDATASDCAGAIGQIDPSNAAAINPSGGTTKNEADGTWISTYNSGSCGVAGFSFDNCSGLGTCSDSLSNTDGQTLIDIANAIVSGCTDGGSGQVNGCAVLNANTEFGVGSF